MKYIVNDREADPSGPLGGKARALAELRAADLPIPAWFIVLPAAFEDSLSDAQRDTLKSAEDGEALRCALAELRPSDAVTVELAQAFAALCPDGAPVAVRSSASDEDGAQHSFAGQLDSFLFVSAGEVAAKVAEVWRSAFSDRILAYRRAHHLEPAPRPPAVLVQRMVRADAAGVAFGADPVSGRRRIAVVSAVLGLGTALVSGDADADTYHVDGSAIIDRKIAHKRTAHRAAPGSGEGVEAVTVPEVQARAPALGDEQVLAVANLVRRTGRHFGRPQDVEWAVEGGKLYLLQSRPITSLSSTADPDGVVNLWDNSNIAESYNGITTPLTFSFARSVYEEVYHQFCRTLSVPEAKIEASADVFRNMLGLIRGRVYYNLLNWYRLLTLLPGFKANRAFMEQMMGVKQALPEDLLRDLTPTTTWGERLIDRCRMMGSMLAMTRNQLGIGRQIRAFYARLEEALGKGRPDLSGLRADELVAYYRSVESKLLRRWDAPLVNDFFAMIFYGLLGKLSRQWCGDEEGTLQNDLLCGEGGMISAEPAARVRTMAELAAQNPDLIDALCEGTLAEARAAAAKLPAFDSLYREYLEKFGDRCLEELKLESPTLLDDPLTLLRSVGQLSRRVRESGGKAPVNPEAEMRRRAEERVRATLRWRPMRRLIFRWVLRNARARVRDRENLRFERTRVFGRVRAIAVELGRRFYAEGLLDHPRDIFYLEMEECLGHVCGTVSMGDLRGLAALRKAEFERYREGPPPADRFQTYGAIHHGNTFQSNAAAAEVPAGDTLKGLGCCPGVVRGPARVITDPRNATLRHGDVLVAERTDPGWIMLFPSAAGLLVERGSLLSHSAIVAREMGIPAVVALTGVTRWLRDGDEVELNGSTGVVVRLAAKGNGATPSTVEPQKEVAHGK